MITQKQIDDFRRSDAVLSLLKTHSKISPLKQLLWLAFDWAVILGAAWSSIYSQNTFIYLLSVAVIAGRQHALLVIMHEASHYRISKHKGFNDFISDIFAAYPLLFVTSFYRQHHLAHHKYLNTDQDPDWVRKIKSDEWIFPKTHAQMAQIMLKQCLRSPLDWLMISYIVTKTGGFKKPLFWFGLLGAVTYLNAWTEFSLFWLVPMFTVFPVFQRIRSISEHFGLPNTHELNSSRNVVSSIYESAFFSPHDSNYHLLHHIFPSVPHYNLKNFDQELLRNEFYRKIAHRNSSFLFGSESVLSDLVRESPNKISDQKAS